MTYQPSVDINQLNVAMVLDRLYTYGSEDFKVNKTESFNGQWEALLELRENCYEKSIHILVKDL